MILSMITAIAHHRVIGLNGSMPWHLPADLIYFKKTTLGSPVIMGRKTFDSIGKPLPGRTNIVLSRSDRLEIEGCIVVKSLDDALVEVGKVDEAFIIGGAQLYRQALPICNRLYLTHIEASFEGDTFFPDYTKLAWKQLSFVRHDVDHKNQWPYAFEILERELAT